MSTRKLGCLNVTDTKSKILDLLSTQQAEVERGVPVDVQVPAKGATGHVWSIEADPGQVRVLGHTKRPSEESFGGGGVEVFTLQPLTEGRTTINFQLGAPWKKAPAEKHELSLDVLVGKVVRSSP